MHTTAIEAGGPVLAGVCPVTAPPVPPWLLRIHDMRVCAASHSTKYVHALYTLALVMCVLLVADRYSCRVCPSRCPQMHPVLHFLSRKSFAF